MSRSSTLLNGALIPCTLALLAMLGLSLRRPAVREADASAPASSPPASAPAHPAAEQARQFFGWAGQLRWAPLTNSSNPFFTLAIQSAPPPTPAPPAPATRKVDLTYRGFFETSAGVRRAVVQVADKQVLALRGDKVIADLVASVIELRQLALTNAAGTAVRLEFAKPRSIEIPAK